MKLLGKIISVNIICDIKESYLVPKNPMPLGVGVSVQGELIEKVSGELELDKTLLNRNAVDVARTEKMPDNLGNVDDKATFSYYIWNALSLDKTLSKNIPLENWIYGELMPKNTPTIFDEIVILIGDTVLGGRTWEGSFFYPFHDALKSQVSIVAILSETEVE